MNLQEVDAKYPGLVDGLGLDRAALAGAMPFVDSLVDRAITEMRTLPWGTEIKKPYIGTSGGKDSVVIEWLTNKAFPIRMPVVHTPKGITHPETVAFLYERSITTPIIYCPSSQHRLLGFDTQIDGTRIAEHNRTDGRSTDFVRNGQNVSRTELTMWCPNGLFGLNFVFPIYDWSDEEVWACIFANDIPFTREYLCLSAS